MRPPPFTDTTHARDCECKRHGTVTADLVTGHQCGRRPASGARCLSPSTGRQLPSRNQTSAGTTAHTETLACDLPVRVRVHAEARAESRGVVLRQGGSHLASRSGFEGRTRGTHGANRQPVAFKWTCKDTPAIIVANLRPSRRLSFRLRDSRTLNMASISIVSACHKISNYLNLRLIRRFRVAKILR